MKTPPIISPEEFPWWRFEKYVFPEKRKKANIGTRQGRRYLDMVTAFDIETTALPEIEESIMYVWQWQFGNWCTVMGRTWEELLLFILKLREVVAVDRSLVILVHNLSY